MTAPLRLPALIALALIWVQTAAAWHETEHALHGHAIDDIACEILSGTAEQPADLDPCLNAPTDVDPPAVRRSSGIETDLTARVVYHSRAPPLLKSARP